MVLDAVEGVGFLKLWLFKGSMDRSNRDRDCGFARSSSLWRMGLRNPWVSGCVVGLGEGDVVLRLRGGEGVICKRFYV